MVVGTVVVGPQTRKLDLVGHGRFSRHAPSLRTQISNCGPPFNNHIMNIKSTLAAARLSAAKVAVALDDANLWDGGIQAA